jgi:hypothetical protein
VVVLEHGKRSSPSAEVAGLVRRRTVTAGDSRLAFYTFGAATIRT